MMFDRYICFVGLFFLMLQWQAGGKRTNEITFVNDNYALCVNNKTTDLIQKSLIPMVINYLLQERFDAISRIRVLDAAIPADRLAMQSTTCLFTHGVIDSLLKPGDHIWGLGVDSSSNQFRALAPSLHIHEIRGFITRRNMGLGNETVVGGDPLALVPYLSETPNLAHQNCLVNATLCDYGICTVQNGPEDNIASIIRLLGRANDKKPSLTIRPDELPITALMQCETVVCTSPICVIVAASMGWNGTRTINMGKNNHQIALNDHLTSLLGPATVLNLTRFAWHNNSVGVKYGLVKFSRVKANEHNLRSTFPFHLFKSTFPTLRVFLDHGGVNFHGEVFFSVASLIMKKIRSNPLTAERHVVFLISEWFGESSGMRPFWNKYVTEHSLPAEVKWVPMQNYYEPIVPRRGCGKDATTAANLHYDLRVVVTSIATTNSFLQCSTPYANNSRYIFVIHRPQNPLQREAALYWNNSYVASQSMANLEQISPERLFTPSLMPIQPTPPHCWERPVAIIQGGISTRRVLTELLWLLDNTPRINITIRILSLESLPAVIPADDDRIDFRQKLPMTEFHESFQGAAFIMPLIFPGENATASYLQGHPTSSIAYGIHFGLRFIGHSIIHQAYAAELKGRRNYWHGGSRSVFIASVRRALRDLRKWCASKSSRQWPLKSYTAYSWAH